MKKKCEFWRFRSPTPFADQLYGGDIDEVSVLVVSVTFYFFFVVYYF